MRRAVQLGQIPRRLQLNATTLAIRGEPTHTIHRVVRDFGELGARTVEITAAISGVTPWSFSMISLRNVLRLGRARRYK